MQKKTKKNHVLWILGCVHCWSGGNRGHLSQNLRVANHGSQEHSGEISAVPALAGLMVWNRRDALNQRRPTQPLDQQLCHFGFTNKTTTNNNNKQRKRAMAPCLFGNNRKWVCGSICHRLFVRQVEQPTTTSKRQRASDNEQATTSKRRATT